MKIGKIKPVKDYNLKNFNEPVGFKLEIFHDDPEVLAEPKAYVIKRFSE